MASYQPDQWPASIPADDPRFAALRQQLDKVSAATAERMLGEYALIGFMLSTGVIGVGAAIQHASAPAAAPAAQPARAATPAPRPAPEPASVPEAKPAPMPAAEPARESGGTYTPERKVEEQRQIDQAAQFFGMFDD